MSEINYQEGHETAGQAKPVAWGLVDQIQSWMVAPQPAGRA
ncbi:hypothetical protein QCG82_01025 [Escherichia coli]